MTSAKAIGTDPLGHFGSIERRGSYRVERLLGRGGMSVVYEVVHEGLNRHFALKVLQKPGDVTASRLAREARALAQLCHPNIVAPVDCWVEDGAPFLVLELAIGETLAQRLSRVGRLALEDIAGIFLPLCSAMEAAHAAGLIHRDLKPSNVMLAEGPYGRLTPKVLDFGVARRVESAEPTLTGGGVIGTVGYLSPEATRGERGLTAQTDVYALGIMLFECATGRRPHVGESAYDVMHATLTVDPPAPSSFVPRLPASFDALVISALARERSTRTPSASALGRALFAHADAPTRALWEPEFGAGARADGQWATDRSRETLTERARPVLVNAPERPQASRAGRWREAIAFGALVLAAVLLTAQLRRRPGDGPSLHVPSPVVDRSPASSPSVDPRGAESAGGLAPLAPAQPAPSAASAPAGGDAPVATRRPAPSSPRPSVASAIASSSGGVAAPEAPKVERGTNGVVILQ